MPKHHSTGQQPTKRQFSCRRSSARGGDGCLGVAFVRVGEISAEGADATWRTLMFAGAFGLGFVSENQFVHGVATGDRGIKGGHDELLGMRSDCFSLDGFAPKAINQ
jgi:hypothetical protein